MTRVVLSLGSNCGDRKKQLDDSINWLKAYLKDIEVSDIYETPCALHSGSSYFNCVLRGDLDLNLKKFDENIKEFERVSGRDNDCRNRGDVPIDIDIVIANDEILKEWDFRQNFFKIGFNMINSNI